jgi:hypothetical protein
VPCPFENPLELDPANVVTSPGNIHDCRNHHLQHRNREKKSHLPLVVIVRIKSLSVAYMILVVLMTIRFSADENFTFVPDPS